MPTFGRPVHLRGSPHRLRPGTSPHALRIPPRGGHPALRRFTPPADDALPPSLDMTPLIRAPEGLQPSRTTRCSAHTTPAADFCDAVGVNRFTLSHDSVTHHRPPEVSSTAFDAQPPDLPPAVLMEMGFAAFCPLAPCRRPHHPILVHRLASLLHASFTPRLATTPLRFAITSPPSGCEEDFHLQAVKHARHTKENPGLAPWAAFVRRFAALADRSGGWPALSRHLNSRGCPVLVPALFAGTGRGFRL